MEERKGRVRSVSAALHSSVLVLNQDYEPLNVCNVRRAIVLLGHGKAEVVEESERLLRSFRDAFKIPSVIRMVYYIRRPRPIARLTRREVFARDGFCCQYCGTKTQDLTLDHILPRHRGGEHTWENLVAACRACNHRKAGMMPKAANMTLSRKPKAPRPNPYFHFHQRTILNEWRPFIPWLD